MIDLQGMASLFIILKNPHTVDILTDLIDGQKTWAYFLKKYGSKGTDRINVLLASGLIYKKLDKTKKPLGYFITDYGKLVRHSCINFERNFN